MKIIFTIDVEKSKNPFSLDKANLNKTLAFLEKSKIETILFTTGDLLTENKQYFNKISKKHEIQLHGYLHERWDLLSKEKKEETLKKAITNYKKVFNKSPKGFRAPQFSSDFDLIVLLNKYNFEYDSSIVQFPLSQSIFFPSKILLYLSQSNFKSKIKKSHLSIKEIPVSSLILPVSFFSMRILPLSVFVFFAKCSLLFKKEKNLIFLSHSYELNNRNIQKLNTFIGRVGKK